MHGREQRKRQYQRRIREGQKYQCWGSVIFGCYNGWGVCCGTELGSPQCPWAVVGVLRQDKGRAERAGRTGGDCENRAGGAG